MVYLGLHPISAVNISRIVIRDIFGTEEEKKKLRTISRSSKEAFSRVQRARILLAYPTNEAINSIAKRENTTRPTVEKCVDKALTGGIEVALSDLKRT